MGLFLEPDMSNNNNQRTRNMYILFSCYFIQCSLQTDLSFSFIQFINHSLRHYKNRVGPRLLYKALFEISWVPYSPLLQSTVALYHYTTIMVWVRRDGPFTFMLCYLLSFLGVNIKCSVSRACIVNTQTLIAQENNSFIMNRKPYNCTSISYLLFMIVYSKQRRNCCYYVRSKRSRSLQNANAIG